MIVRVYMTVLTNACLDQFKLALMSFADSVGPNTGYGWCVGDEKYLGYVLCSEMRIKNGPAENDKAIEVLAHSIAAAMRTNRVQFLSLIVRTVPESSRGVAAVLGGTLDRERKSEGVYRDPPSEPEVT